MARNQANLRFDFLKGLRGSSKDAKILYTALLIEPTVNQAGIGALRERYWAKEAELTRAEVDQALRELDDGDWVLVDEDTEEILVRTIVRRDGVAEKPALLWAACRAALMVRSPRLRKALAAELRKLPPKPPPTVMKNGRLYEHPDPHATADEIDPPTGPKPPAREPSPNGSGMVPEHSKTTVPEPSGNHSTTMPAPTSHHPERVTGEPFENHSRIDGSCGGGSGGSYPSSLVATQVEFSASRARPRTRTLAQARARTPTRARAAEAEQLIATWRAEHTPRYTDTTYRQMLDQVTAQLADGGTPDYCLAALRDWDTRSRAAPGLFPRLYDDAVRAARNPHTDSTTDQRVRAALELAQRLHTREQQPQLRVIEGSA